MGIMVDIYIWPRGECVVYGFGIAPVTYVIINGGWLRSSVLVRSETVDLGGQTWLVVVLAASAIFGVR